MVSQMLCHKDTHDWLGDKINGHSLRHDIPGLSESELDGSFLPDHEIDVDGTRTTVSELLARGRIVILVGAQARSALEETAAIPFADTVVAQGLPELYPEIVVVRPDGYVAWAGESSQITLMRKVLEGHFALRWTQDH